MEKENPFIDWNLELRFKEHHLILLDQEFTIQHATFRLRDSIPRKEREELLKLKMSFEKLNPKPWDSETQKRYFKVLGKKYDSFLDKGYGSCILKQDDIRDIVDQSINFFNSEYYQIFSYVIMPNHVHILLMMYENNKIEDVLGRIKQYTARKINKTLNRNGEIWGRETYCRMMRGIDHFKVTEDYIRKNPRFLKRGEFTYRNYRTKEEL